MNMHDLAETMDMPEGVGMTSSAKPFYPSGTFDVNRVPELKGINIGEKVTLVIECRVTRIKQDEQGTDYTIEFRKGGIEKDEKSKAGDFVKSLSSEAEKTKGGFSEDITRVPGQGSKAHDFNQQLSS